MGGQQECSEPPLRTYRVSLYAKDSSEGQESLPCRKGSNHSPSSECWDVISHSYCKFKPSLKTLLTSCIVLMLCCTVRGEEQCSNRNVEIRLEPKGNVMCYECSSWTHPLCEDPFNFTLSIEKGPPVASCDGCCVKLVQHIGTPYASIRRTCTEKLQINLFVVDHVCMMEGGGQGHMCFCEEDLCNAAPHSLRTPHPWAPFTFLLLPPMLLHAFLAWDPR